MKCHDLPRRKRLYKGTLFRRRHRHTPALSDLLFRESCLSSEATTATLGDTGDTQTAQGLPVLRKSSLFLEVQGQKKQRAEGSRDYIGKSGDGVTEPGQRGLGLRKGPIWERIEKEPIN